MGWSRRPNLPPNNPDAGDENNPLADNMRLRPRRSVSNSNTQPIDSDSSPSIHDQHTVVDNNFSSRTRTRRERQLTSPFSTQRLGSWAASPDNSRKLLMIGAGVIGFLLLIAVMNIASRSYTSDAPEDTVESSPVASVEVGGITTGPLASPDPATGSQPVTNIPGTDPGEQPASPGNGAFVVSGTGAEGLFLRQDHSTSAQILGTLPEGTRIESLGETFNDGTRDWLKVRAQPGEGWVAKQYLQPAP